MQPLRFAAAALAAGLVALVAWPAAAGPAAVAIRGGTGFDDGGTPVPQDFTLPTAGIAGVTVEGPDQIERRVTATRLFLVGIFAFGSLLALANGKTATESITALPLRAK